MTRQNFLLRVMASSSLQSLRASDYQNVQNRHPDGTSSSHATFVNSQKSVPAILSRKRKFDYNVMDPIAAATEGLQNRVHNVVLPPAKVQRRGVLEPVSVNRIDAVGAIQRGENVDPTGLSCSMSSTVGILGNVSGLSSHTLGQTPSAASSRVPLAVLSTSSDSINTSRNKMSNVTASPAHREAESAEMDAVTTWAGRLFSQKSPSNGACGDSSNVILPFHHPTGKKIRLRDSWSRFREFAIKTALETPSRCPAPLPPLCWADKQEVWDLMCKKESGMYKRPTGESMMSRHPSLEPRMRSILIDWLLEVCEVYTLHRETFYLAVDFIDRFLGATPLTPNNRLQLVGVTCLFLAAKIEEIYPPKLQEFAFVTDGACSEDEIVQMELVILKGLNWGLSPMTGNGWMKVFMQVNSFLDSSKNNENEFIFHKYSERQFRRAMQLLDLCVLDLGSLSFKNSVLAASVICHCLNQEAALRASGYRWEDIAMCVEWMTPFAHALLESEPPASPKTFSGVPFSDQHNIQTHSVELSTLALAHGRQEQIAAEMEIERNTGGRESPEPNASEFPMEVLEMTPPDCQGDMVFTSKMTSTLQPRCHPPQSSSVFLSPGSDEDSLW